MLVEMNILCVSVGKWYQGWGCEGFESLQDLQDDGVLFLGAFDGNMRTTGIVGVLWGVLRLEGYI